MVLVRGDVTAAQCLVPEFWGQEHDGYLNTKAFVFDSTSKSASMESRQKVLSKLFELNNIDSSYGCRYR